ncbi:hypothetical protein KIH74_28765 [Kineosporia sp. J2-2]|uniref:Glutamine amidotransferase type-2 domain-containing protein n=1 Tax=Kineosporia corallincola TaxID=2835133 RepID=A0ABS5TPE3_9ACTN|nr:hypothetical protein [Kineosporia corallincola]MBT0772970.1 hypothetical protein [Kineosporia corallincola]
MALLTYLPAGTPPDEQALRRGAWLNPDGHGFAIAAGGHLIIRRNLSFHPLLAEFLILRAQYPDTTAVFHSRRATHGVCTLDNCHPLPIGGSRDAYLAHHGVLPRRLRPRGKDLRSDSQIAATEHLPSFGPLTRRCNRMALERWLPDDNSAVILTQDPDRGAGAYLLHEANGTWQHGRWYSGHDHLPPGE